MRVTISERLGRKTDLLAFDTLDDAVCNIHFALVVSLSNEVHVQALAYNALL